MAALAPVLRWIHAVNQTHPWSHNDHYLPWVLRRIPPGARTTLDVGCGTGTLLRALRHHVPGAEGIDPDPRMAGTRSDLLSATGTYDLVTAVAVVHHLPLVPALQRLRELVRPGGRLLVVGCYRAASPSDRALELVSIPANLLTGLVTSSGTAPDGMSAPVAPAAETLAEIRAAAGTVLPGARIRRKLFWRYTLVWDQAPT